jgi:hypothetical protein
MWKKSEICTRRCFYKDCCGANTNFAGAAWFFWFPGDAPRPTACGYSNWILVQLCLPPVPPAEFKKDRLTHACHH